MNKLLNKPFKAFTIYALIILACSIPVYYVVVDYIWLNELDEHNQIVKERIEASFKNTHFEDIELNSLLKNWDKLQPSTKLSPSYLSNKKPDSTYTITKRNRTIENDETDRFRVLSTCININGKPHHLQIETNVEEANETMFAIAIVTLLLFSILATGFIFLNRRIAKQIWQPFRNTLDKLKSFDITTQQTITFDKTDIEEFDNLNISLQKLIDNNIFAYHQHKSFIENASHELQTPLSVLKSKLDLLLQNKDITIEQSDIINSIELTLSRVSRINKNLLLLSKIENNQYSEQETIEISKMTNDTITMLNDYIIAKNITVDNHIKDQLSIVCNKTLFEILITNLLINSITHNYENGKIYITLTGKTLTFSNSGKSQLDKNNIFKRFTVSSSETTSSGLGLAIVQEVCNRYNWNIKYNFHNNFHIFSVQF